MCSYSSDLYHSEQRWVKQRQTGPTRMPGRRQECNEDESAMISKILYDKSHMIWGKHQQGRIHSEQNTSNHFTHSSLHPSAGCMQVSPLRAEKPQAGWEVVFFYFFLSVFGGVGNVASHLGWTGCLESRKEVGAGKATTTQVLMEKRGFGVMEGAFQRYTEWDRTKTRFSFMSKMKNVE